MLSDKADDVELPSSIRLKNIALNKQSKIIFMDAPKEKISYKLEKDSTILNIPASLQNKTVGKYAVTFKIIL